MNKLVLEKVFKPYDIRGLSPEELSPALSYAIGKALADYLPKGKVAVGRDMRADSAELALALRAGLLHQGRAVVDLGLICSDTMYFAIGEQALAGGAMVTASHNAAGYDGIKLTSKGVVPISADTGLLEIEEAIGAEHYKSAHLHGKLTHLEITRQWVEYALKKAELPIKPMSIAVDFGNGMASILLPYLSELTPLDIMPLFAKLDGAFPNHDPNPLLPENTAKLQSVLKRGNFACGIAFDGDGDRAFFCDERGQRISASILGVLLAKHILHIQPGSTILYNAICSQLVPETIKALGGKPVRTRVGHSYIKAAMREYNAALAIEHSGHFYFAHNYFADSGLIAALTMLGILSESKKPLSELVQPYQKLYFQSGELNFAGKYADILGKIESILKPTRKDTLDGVTMYFAQYWLNVRPSGTEPLVRVNVEASSQKKLNEITGVLKEILSVFSSRV